MLCCAVPPLQYCECTDGSHVEVKASALVWHYGDADPDFGNWQVRQGVGAVCVWGGVLLRDDTGRGAMCVESDATEVKRARVYVCVGRRGGCPGRRQGAHWKQGCLPGCLVLVFGITVFSPLRRYKTPKDHYACRSMQQAHNTIPWFLFVDTCDCVSM
jgi:hypothetical protein